MNVIIFTLIAFVTIYLLLRLIARASAKKISKAFRILIFRIYISGNLASLWGKIFILFTINLIEPWNN